MKISFLGQGYEVKSKNSVGNKLIECFSDQSFHSFYGLSAFASKSGIKGLAKHLLASKRHLDKIVIVVGIDQKGTSKEALEELYKLDIEAFVFYQPSSPIYHPKLYLFEGVDTSVLIVGSSNLTTPGLFLNIESSLQFRLDNQNENDRDIVDQIKKYFKGIFEQDDPNIKKINTKLIERLVKAKLIPLESERKGSNSNFQDDAESGAENLSNLFPKRDIPKVPLEFRGQNKKSKTKNKKEDVNSEKEALGGNVVWTRLKLPSSSVQGSAPGTNSTGGLRLVQAGFIVDDKKINQTNYFRQLFDGYAWRTIRTSPFVEGAEIPFEITIKGKNIGRHVLMVRHKPSGEAGQNNYTTSISWGPIGDIISKGNLGGLRLDIIAPVKKGKPYRIVIQ